MLKQTLRLSSHIGSQPLLLPQGVSIVRTSTATSPNTTTRLGRLRFLEVNGPLGKVTLPTLPFVRIKYEEIEGSQDKQCVVSVERPENPDRRAVWGTTRALLGRAVMGVTEGYTLPLRFVGVGYRAQLDGEVLLLKLGFRDVIKERIPTGISVNVLGGGTRLSLSGIDWQAITQFAARIRTWRPPEPYNGKGVFVGDETIKLKAGKKK